MVSVNQRCAHINFLIIEKSMQNVYCTNFFYTMDWSWLWEYVTLLAKPSTVIWRRTEQPCLFLWGITRFITQIRTSVSLLGVRVSSERAIIIQTLRSIQVLIIWTCLGYTLTKGAVYCYPFVVHNYRKIFIPKTCLLCCYNC